MRERKYRGQSVKDDVLQQHILRHALDDLRAYRRIGRTARDHRPIKSRSGRRQVTDQQKRRRQLLVRRGAAVDERRGKSAPAARAGTDLRRRHRVTAEINFEPDLRTHRHRDRRAQAADGKRFVRRQV